jgi:hypothetical protein
LYLEGLSKGSDNGSENGKFFYIKLYFIEMVGGKDKGADNGPKVKDPVSVDIA